MALITANQLAVGLFNIAAGGYAAEATANIAANEALAANSYINLGASGLNPQFGGSNVFTNTEFAAGLVARLMSGASASLATTLTTFVVNYIAANPSKGRGEVAVEMIKAVVAIAPGDVVLGAAAAPFKAKLALAEASTSTSKDLSALNAVANPPSNAPINFTATAGETLTGTSNDDTFNARILDNANTAQSGDKIVGGAGNDRMNLDIGSSAAFSITLESTGVEQVAIRSQTNDTDASQNNLNNNQLSLDAQRMTGVTQFETNNSRSDVIIEDVRIAGGAATKTVTIAMVETDPGNVDFGVYFNQLSLRNTSSGTASLNVFLMDVAATQVAATNATPLLNHNFNAYSFYANGVKVVLGGAGTAAGAAIDNAVTYAELKAAFQLALATAKTGPTGANTEDLTSSVTVTLSGPVNMTTEALKNPESAVVAANFLNLTGEILTLTTSTATSITSTAPGQPPGGWIAAGPAPITGAIVQTLNTGTTTSTELVTSKVILDDVGMGSTGGDLVIGGMSVGQTSDSRGVERFEMEVRDNSKLQTINGTNNALREVVVVNGITTNVNGSTGATGTDNAYVGVVQNAGNLTVNGNVNLTSVAAGGGVLAGTASDTILNGVNNSNSINGYQANHHGAFGFTDVRLLDATAMTGKFAFTAQVTTDSIAKYVNRTDVNASPTADVAGSGNVNFSLTNPNNGANFVYSGGTNNDTMVITIDGDAAASRSSVVSGQSDLTFVVNGNAGDDKITLNLINGGNSGGAANWASNQDLNNNIIINGGAGNDTIRTPGAGDIQIFAGEGNDVVYTDNTGRQAVTITPGAVGINVAATTSNAVWAFNVFNGVAGTVTPYAAPVAVAAADLNISNLRSDANEAYNLYKATLTVTFKNIPSVAITLANNLTYKTTDLEINQAIKNAINTDVTLNKLLVAQDGPGNTLIVTSLIDGARVVGDLVVAVAVPAATTVYSAAELAGMSAAYNTPGLTNALGLGAQAAALADFTAQANYVTLAAKDSLAVDLLGANSAAVSDNFITPGTGNDIIVLGTTVGATAAASSNEVIVFTAGFGDDVIVNFTVTGVAGAANLGGDHLDFSAFLTQDTPATASTATVTAAAVTVAAVLSAADNQITIIAETAANDTLAEVTTLIKAAVDTAAQLTVTKQLYIAYNGTNVGTVYSVVNGLAANDAVVTREGSIDLADTLWSAFTPANATIELVGITVGAQAEGSSTF